MNVLTMKLETILNEINTDSFIPNYNLRTQNSETESVNNTGFLPPRPTT
jgi:hypothetical protein